MSSSLYIVRQIAESEGYLEVYFNKQSKVISFVTPLSNCRQYYRINVYYTTDTVGTCVDHPLQGHTQLFRKNVDVNQLRDIFRNPRVHTGKGYHQTSQSKKRKRLHSSNTLPITFPIGSRAYVRGFSYCTILTDMLTSQGPFYGLIKVRYDNWKTYHVSPDQLLEVDDWEVEILEQERFQRIAAKKRRRWEAEQAWLEAEERRRWEEEQEWEYEEDEWDGWEYEEDEWEEEQGWEYEEDEWDGWECEGDDWDGWECEGDEWDGWECDSDFGF